MEILPPLIYIVRKKEQPELRAWTRFIAFAQEWNQGNKAQFEPDSKAIKETADRWNLILPAGAHDTEFSLLNNELARLNKSVGLTWFMGVNDKRTKDDLAKCPFVKIISDGYGDAFYVNAKQVMTMSSNCEHCGNTAQFSGRVLDIPLIDESYLTANNEVNRLYAPGGLDFVNLPNGGLLINQKVRAILESLQVKGYQLMPVKNKSTGEVSEKLFLLKATTTVPDPCPEHTPRAENAICPVCGAVSNAVAGYFHVQNSQLMGAEVFSVSRFGYSGIFFSQRIFQAFKAANLQKLLVSKGIEYCEH